MQLTFIRFLHHTYHTGLQNVSFSRKDNLSFLWFLTMYELKNTDLTFEKTNFQSLIKSSSLQQTSEELKQKTKNPTKPTWLCLKTSARL